MKKKIIIIGAGLGGLAAGCRLAAAGHTVEILEQRSTIGGLAATQHIGDFEVEIGPSAITAPALVEDIFQAAGKPLPEDLQWLPVAPAYRVFDHQLRSFNIKFDQQFLVEEVQRWDANETSACQEYLKNIHPFFSPKFQDLSDLPFLHPLSMLKTVPDIIRLRGLQSTYSFVSQYFNDPFLRAALSLKPFLMGSNPMEVNIFTSLNMQMRDAKMMYIVGGTGTIIKHLAKLFQELGGKIHLKAEVVEIISRHRQVSGVRMKDGGLHPADVIISNANVADTYDRLIKQRNANRLSRKKAARQNFSSSIFAIYLVTSRRYLDTPLAHHNVIVPRNFPKLLEGIFHRGVLSSDPAISLHMPSRTDNTPAAADREVLMIHMPVPNLTAEIDWSSQARPLREQVLSFLEERFLPDLRASIVVEKVLTPEDFHENFNAPFGAPFSLQTSPFQAAWFRPHNRSKQLKNLYLVGAGTHPGPGISAVLSSAEIVEKLIGSA
ncbi:MAG: phytoene desaturase [Anaerolineaceae bacterium]|nr:phytoene desaturase [Anaerolineaceae bacterium]